MSKKTLVNLTCKVNSSSISTKIIDGDKHYIVPSATLPDNIVMNGGLYPPDEIEKGYKSLEGVPAPASHPMIDNKYVSARDVRAINKFHVGAYVTNVERKGGRVFHDTVINERIAMQTEIGRNLIDAINRGDPVHTSTGVFLIREDLESPLKINSGPSKGKEYSWIARNLQHDHQALLLNEMGAATPDDGVGMMVNSEGEDEEFEVMFVNLTSGEDFSGSSNMIRESLQEAIKEKLNPLGDDDVWIYVEDYNADTVIYCVKGELFAIEYKIDSDNNVEFTSEPKETERKTTFEFNKREEGLFARYLAKLANSLGINVKSITNTNSIEVDPMKEKMIAALNAAGIATEGLSDDQLFDKHSQLVSTNAANGVKSLTAEDVAKIVTDTLAANKLAETKTAKESLVAEVIANSEYKEEDKEMLLNTDERILKSFLPKPTAATLGRPQANSQSETSIINDTMPE